MSFLYGFLNFLDILGYVFAFANDDISNLKNDRGDSQKAASNGHNSAINSQNEQHQKQMKLADDLGEEMQCSICIDYVYQCVTLIPCLHNVREEFSYFIDDNKVLCCLFLWLDEEIWCL